MAYRARVATQWVNVVGKNRLKVARDHAFAGAAFTDVTGQPDAAIIPMPNALTVQVEPLDEAQLAVLEADAALIVLWSEVIHA